MSKAVLALTALTALPQLLLMSPAPEVAVVLKDAAPERPVLGALSRALKAEGYAVLSLPKAPADPAKLNAQLQRRGLQVALLGSVRYDGPHKVPGGSVQNVVLELTLISVKTGAKVRSFQAEGFGTSEEGRAQRAMAAARAVEMLFGDLGLDRALKRALRGEQALD